MPNIQYWGGSHLILHYLIYLKSMLIKSWVKDFKSQIFMFFVTVCSKLTQSCMWILSCKHPHLFEMMYHLYFRRYVNFILQTYCNWTVDDPIFALFFAKETLIFCNLLYLFYLKLISPSEIISTNDEHVFLRILVTHLCVLCFDIYAIPSMYTLYYQTRLSLVSEICLVNKLTFSAWDVTVIF